jgi:hypothetical protein
MSITNTHAVSQSSDPLVVNAEYEALRLAVLSQLEGPREQVYFRYRRAGQSDDRYRAQSGRS